MIKIKFDIGALFYNNKFVLVFSIFVSFIVWISMSLIGSGTETSITISDIPINIPLSDNAKSNDLSAFILNGKEKASVTVSGNSMVITKLKKDNIQVLATQANSIDKPGTYEFLLVAKPIGIATDFEVDQDSISPQKITVLIDRYKELDIPVTDNIKYKTDPEHFAAPTKFRPDYIKVSGPETIVSKVAKIKAEYNIAEILKQSKSIVPPIVIYDANDNILPDTDINMLTISNKNVQADISVLNKRTISLNATFGNMPSGFDKGSRVSLNPTTIEIAIPDELLPTLAQIDLDPIDFSKINLKNNGFELPVNLPQGCKNLSNAYTASVKINMEGITNKALNISNFAFLNIPEGKNPSVLTKSVAIEVNGPSNQIQSITEQNIIANIDLKDKEQFTGHTELPVSFVISSPDGCWVYGNYTVSVTITG